MAYLGTKPTGGRFVQVDGRDGRRKTIGLGVIGQRKAEQVRHYIEDLVAARQTGTTPEPKTRQWLATIDGKLRRRLVALSLAEPGAAQAELGTLGPFLDVCLNRKRKTVKPQTMPRLEQARDSMVAFFTSGCALHSITDADAEDFQAWLRNEAPHRRRRGEFKGLAEATVGKRCKDAREFFKYAVQLRLIEHNPFTTIKCATPGTRRHAYITQQDAQSVMAQLPDASWRLLFALARWGGLRVISEPRALRWEDVDWTPGHETLLVRSPKTEHLDGHESRRIPLTTEVLEPMREVFDQAQEGEPLVLPWLTSRSSASLRNPLMKAIARSGVKVWPRLWHNLRSTRQTELERDMPTHVVCTIMGNSESVANRHYLQVTEEDFDTVRGLSRKRDVETGDPSPSARADREPRAAQGAAVMHGHRGSGEKETALAGPRRDMGGHESVSSDPYGI